MLKYSKIKVACGLCVCAALGCASDKHKTPGDAGSDGGNAAALQAATFNAGLIDSVGYVAERAPLVVDALAGLDVELLCVQEFWQKAHWDALVQAQSSRLQHVLRIADRPGVHGMCTPDEFNPLQACAEAKCGSAGASDLVSCTSTQCAASVASLSSSCISCLLGNVGSGDFNAIRTACVGGASMASDAGVVPAEQRAYLSGGSYGIGLLSSHAFVATDTKLLDSSTIRRGILYAQLEHPRLGTLHVFCTHLAAIENGVKYEGSYGSWVGENAAHVKALRDWVSEKAGGSGRVLVLGDLNSGPAVAAHGVEPSFADNYAVLPASGLRDVFLSGSSAACTFCADNPLVVPGDTGVNAAIDHMLTRGLSDASTAERIFMDPVEISVPVAEPDGGLGDAGGTQTKRVRLSDHYGLRGSLLL